MYPLIEIKSVPIEIEMKTTRSKLEYNRSTAEVDISRSKGGLQIQNRPTKINIDTFEARNSITPTVMRAVEQNAHAGRQAANDATGTYAQQGKLLLEAKIGQEMVTQFAANAQTANLKTNVGIQFLPSVGPKITWDAGEMSMKYQMDKMTFDWKQRGGEFNFVPGGVEFSITQMPDVVIKYVGGPLYVPPSAEPGYEANTA